MAPRHVVVLFFAALLLGVQASTPVDDIPDVDADIFDVPESEISFHVDADMTFGGLKFADDNVYQYALYCGFDASDQGCTDCTDKPKWSYTCPKIPGAENIFRSMVFWGKPTTNLGSAWFGSRFTSFPARGDYDKGGILMGEFAYYNVPIERTTAPVSIQLDVTVVFTGKNGIDGVIEFKVPLTIQDSGHCEGLGCPWNNPRAWLHDVNEACVDGHLPDGTKCCRYITERNALNQCGDIISLESQYPVGNPLVHVNGSTYQIYLDGFHRNALVHGGGMFQDYVQTFYVAPPNAITYANLHARLIPACPSCEEGEIVRLDDQRCYCKCSTDCHPPATRLPNCTCVEKPERLFRCCGRCAGGCKCPNPEFQRKTPVPECRCVCDGNKLRKRCNSQNLDADVGDCKCKPRAPPPPPPPPSPPPVCPNTCQPGWTRTPYPECKCLPPPCTLTCPAPKVLDKQACECKCPNLCPSTQIQLDDCSCVCPEQCPAPKVHLDHCVCPVPCPSIKAQQDDCSCVCIDKCPAPKAQNPDDCSCFCPQECPAPKAQNPDDCSCFCPNDCPAPKLRNDTDCSCYCPNTCPEFHEQQENCECKCVRKCLEPHTRLDEEACECKCPDVACPEGYVMNPVDCTCECDAIQCPPNQVVSADTCQCVCMDCPAPKVHPQGAPADPCVCECPPNTCSPDEEVNPDDCSCIPIISHHAAAASSGGTNKGVVAGAVVGAVALVALAAVAAVLGARGAGAGAAGGSPLLDPLAGNAANNPVYASPNIEGINPVYSGSM